MRVFRGKKGMTLTETLIVVTILSIVFGLAFLGGAAAIKTLRQNELDADARILYAAAQNRMNELYAAGRLSVLTADSEKQIYILTQQPSDWNTSSVFPSDGLSYITSDSASVKLLFPSGSVPEELTDSEWVVEFNLASAQVYAVFFAKPGTEELSSFYSPNRNTLRASTDARKAYGANVGYYGGGIELLELSSTAALTTAITLTNGEELKAEFSCTIPSEFITYDVNFHITITGLTSGNNIYKDVTLTCSEGSNKRSYTLLIDSLSQRFKDCYCTGGTDFVSRFKPGSAPLTPGENLLIFFTANSVSDLLSSSSDSVETNSLFASYDAASHKALVRFGRHLQNLSPMSGLGNNVTSPVYVSSATQTADIDWVGAYGARLFAPINNSMLQSYDGGSFFIKGLKVQTAADAGLFSAFNGHELKNIYLVGADVSVSSSSSSAAALAARITNTCTITNCRNYLSWEDFHGNTYSSKIYISGGLYNGGLVGYADNALAIVNSFSATTAASAGYIGGLCGYCTGRLAVYESYADSYLAGKTVGGLCGYCANSSTFTNVYTAGFLFKNGATPTASAAGIAPCAVANVSNSYSVFNFGNSMVTAPYSTVKSTDSQSHLYYVSTAAGGNVGIHLPATELKNLDTMTGSSRLGSAWSRDANSGNTLAYNLSPGLNLGSYSYPGLLYNGEKMMHCGDWEDNPIAAKTVRLLLPNGNTFITVFVSDGEVFLNSALTQQAAITDITPSLEGKIFEGYPGFATPEDGFIFASTEDLLSSYTAQFRNLAKLTLMSNGSVYGSYDIDNDQTKYTSLPAQGYTNPENAIALTFQGWYTSYGNDGVKILDKNGSIVPGTAVPGYITTNGKWAMPSGSSGLVLYAHWGFSLTLKNGNTIISNTEVLLGDATHPFPSTTALSYIRGWYSAENDGVKVLNANGTFASNNVPSYIQNGKWQVNTANVTLYAQFNSNLVLYDGYTQRVNMMIRNGTDIGPSGLSAFTRTNWTLEGFYTKNTGNGGTKVLNADGSFSSNNISGYVSNGNWNVTRETTTLYARYKRYIYVYVPLSDLQDSGNYVLANRKTAGSGYCLAVSAGGNPATAPVSFVNSAGLSLVDRDGRSVSAVVINNTLDDADVWNVTLADRGITGLLSDEMTMRSIKTGKYLENTSKHILNMSNSVCKWKFYHLFSHSDVYTGTMIIGTPYYLVIGSGASVSKTSSDTYFYQETEVFTFE